MGDGMTSRQFKKHFLRFFLGIEIIVFGLTYFWGANGIRALINMNNKNLVLQNKVAGIATEITELEGKIEQWHIHPFYREQIAREKLQMARKDDNVYFIK